MCLIIKEFLSLVSRNGIQKVIKTEQQGLISTYR